MNINRISLMVLIISSCLILKKPKPPIVNYSRFSYDFFGNDSFNVKFNFFSKKRNLKDDIKFNIKFNIVDSSFHLKINNELLLKGNSIKAIDNTNKLCFYITTFREKFESIQDRYSVQNYEFAKFNLNNKSKIDSIDINLFENLVYIFNSVSLYKSVIKEDNIILTNQTWENLIEDNKSDTIFFKKNKC